MSCPIFNSNGGIFSQKGYTIKERMEFFYLICIFLRLLFAGIIYTQSNKRITYYVLVVVSLLAIYGNYKNLNECVWWSRKFHLLTSILILLVAVLTLMQKIDFNKYAAYLLYIDVVGGIIWSVYIGMSGFLF
jgi:hypothetical protein